MPATPVPWPLTALPGRRPGEGNGDLLNAFAHKYGDQVRIERVAGLTADPTPVAETIARGVHAVGSSYLVHVWDDKVYVRDIAGVDVSPGVPTSAVTGVDKVTIASNLRPAGPQVVLVSETGVYNVNLTTGDTTSFADGDLGTVESVEYFAGYFVFHRVNGEMVATGLQEVTVDPTSYARAEYSSDPLYRLKSNGSTLLAMGARTIEVWTDVASSPWPFARQTALDVGLLGKWCVAGGANEWEHGVIFIAADYTVRLMEGYETKIVSNEDVSDAIYEYRNDVDQISCTTYGFGPWSIFSISTPTWTWEYCVNTGAWHRRTSHQLPYWRGQFGVLFRGQWYVQGTWRHALDGVEKGMLCQVSPTIYQEAGNPMMARIDSAPIKEFPASMRIPSIDVDVSVGVGNAELGYADPELFLSWSHDGGATWANPLERSLGQAGEYWRKVTYRNLGRSHHHGVILRLEVLDPVPLTLRGAVSTRTQGSRPRQVR